MSQIQHTEVVESARVWLLKSLAVFDDWRATRDAEDQRHHDEGVVDIHTGRPPTPGYMPTYVPLYGGDHEKAGYTPADIRLAAKEARALGQIDYEVPEDRLNATVFGPMVRITTKGKAWLRKNGHYPLVRATQESENDV